MFPLAPLGGENMRPSEITCWRWSIRRGFVNPIAAALNFMYGCGIRAGLPRRRTAAQSDVISRLVSRAVDFYARLNRAGEDGWQHLVPEWVVGIVRPAGPRYGNLVASRVDNLEVAAAIDAQAALDSTVREVLSDPRQLFPNFLPGLACFEKFSSGDRREYVLLVAAQLRAGKLGLTTLPCGGGTVLAVGKQDSLRQREVSHGRRVSQCALHPPPPRHLACPSALLRLKVSNERPMRVSKRDARCWFDQLAVPPALRRWFARPPVTSRELLSIGGFSRQEVASHLQTGEVLSSRELWPVNHVWPMGFSWSSFIAQENLLHNCVASGLQQWQVLAVDAPTPMSFERFRSRYRRRHVF